MIQPEDFIKLQREVEELKAGRERAAGALAELRKQVKKEFGVATARQVAELLKQEQIRREKLAGRVARAKAEFEKKWRDTIDKLKGVGGQDRPRKGRGRRDGRE